MEQLLYFLFFALGLVMIIKGSDWFIDAAVWGAKVFRMPQMIIGATIISICTTLPETFVSGAAALRGETDMAVGNALGSIGFNGGVILAVIILFSKPIIENPRDLRTNSSLLFAALLIAFLAGCFLDRLNAAVGLIFLLLLAYYLFRNVQMARKHMTLRAGHAEAEKDRPDQSPSTVAKNLFFFIVGITLVIFGADLLVDNGVAIAELLGVPSMVIAVTVTSIGTSLPELVTAVSSIRKGASNLGVGNIIGANFLNMSQVLGVSSIIAPISLAHDRGILFFQFPMVFLICLTGVLFCLKGSRQIPKFCGVILLVLYAVFFLSNILRADTPVFGVFF